MGILVSTFEKKIRLSSNPGIPDPDNPRPRSMMAAIRQRLASVRLVSICAPLPRRPRYHLLLPGIRPEERV